MTALLPLLGFLLAVFCFRRLYRPRISLPAAVLSACVAIGAFAVSATEILSLWDGLDRTALLSLWTAALVGLTWLSLRARRLSGQPSDRPRVALGSTDWLSIALIIAILVVVGLIAFVAAPNNFDSMTYHLARVAHWHQNQSVESYPTSLPRQSYMAPGAEYLILHLFVLGGSDRAVNLVQWWALFGCVLGVSLIAGQLGAGRRGQLLASVICVTLPMAVLQGSGTQNDLVAALWVVCSIYFGRLLILEVRLLTTVLLSLSLGLVVVTKSSAAVLLAPFVLVFGVALLRRQGRTAWKTLALLVATVPLLAAPHLVRSHRLWGNPLGPMQEADSSYTYLTDSWTPAAAISGVSRNLALHAGTSWMALDSGAEAAVRGLHRASGIDADDARTTWGGLSFGVMDAFRDEDAAGNPLHLLLLVVVLGGFATRPLRHRDKLLLALCLVSAFILLSTTLRWTPWHSRLHLPLFIVASALIGATLSRWLGVLGSACLCLLLSFAVRSPLLDHQRRPLLGVNSVLRVERSRQYFAALPDAHAAYLKALRILEQEYRCDHVGLALGSDDFEYPLWALSSAAEGPRTRFEHVAVLNLSARLSRSASPPCAILISHTRPEHDLTVGNRRYRLARDLGRLRILLPAPSQARARSLAVQPALSGQTTGSTSKTTSRVTSASGKPTLT